jgi:hypothetical protein
MLEARAVAYVSKTDSVDVLLAAIRACAASEAVPADGPAPPFLLDPPGQSHLNRASGTRILGRVAALSGARSRSWSRRAA